MAKYSGDVAFVHPPGTTGDEGVHYPVTGDGEPDYERPLFFDTEKGYYRDKTDKDPAHFAAYHVDHRDLVPEGGGEPVPVTDAEMLAVQELLDNLRGQ